MGHRVTVSVRVPGTQHGHPPWTVAKDNDPVEGDVGCGRRKASQQCAPPVAGVKNLSPHALLAATTEQIKHGDEEMLTSTAHQALSLLFV